MATGSIPLRWKNVGPVVAEVTQCVCGVAPTLIYNTVCRCSRTTLSSKLMGDRCVTGGSRVLLLDTHDTTGLSTHTRHPTSSCQQHIPKGGIVSCSMSTEAQDKVKFGTSSSPTRKRWDDVECDEVQLRKKRVKAPHAPKGTRMT